ncbi:MAG: hypothetical protein P8Z37_16160 [Acidobacteriota bacterium]|jgi:hypothetical protein
MSKKLCVSAVIVLVLGMVSFVGTAAQEAVQEEQEAQQPEKVEKSMCLACHGSFDDIAAATADFKAPSGETVSPHQYVPHTEGQEIPECINCHVPHPIPPESKDQVIRPEKIDWCYASCHHMNDLQPCGKCH